MVAELKERGPISQIAVVMNVLSLCVGPRVILYKWDGEKLTGCAFFDVQFYVVSMACVKNFVLLGDVYKGTHFLYWEPELNQLIFLGKDYYYQTIYSVEFLIDTPELNLIVTDEAGNLQLLTYSPQKVESRGGERLLPRADFHVGSRISRMCRLKLHSIKSQRQKNDWELIMPLEDEKDQKFMTVSGCIEGAISYLTSVDEMTYRRLYSLHTQLTFRISHLGGLNPRLFRTYRPQDRRRYNFNRNIVDGDLLWEFLQLDYHLQSKLAKNIGTSPNSIINNLLEMDISTRFY
jgi:cleavage and polyadenylation specificity factor subunit 1